MKTKTSATVVLALLAACLCAAAMAQNGNPPAGDTRRTGPVKVHATNSAYVFDRTCEREMRSEDRSYLDLDTGEFVGTHPPGDLFWPLAESDLRVRAGTDLVAVAVPASRWDATADEIVREVAAAAPAKQVRLGGEMRTWFFKTREGATGVLQIVPHDRRPGSVVARYKLVRPRREFAPVATAILAATGNKRFLNLDEGRLEASMPTNSLVAYLEKDPKFGWFMILEPLHNYHTTREEGIMLWNSMTAEDISQPAGLAGAPIDRKGFYELRRNDLPIIAQVPEWGFVQIAEIDLRNTNAPVVILRTKRVKSEARPRGG